jgi:dienelactone hydrolase
MMPQSVMMSEGFDHIRITNNAKSDILRISNEDEFAAQWQLDTGRLTMRHARPTHYLSLGLTLFTLLLLPLSGHTQQQIPDDVQTRQVNIWSEGTRLSGTIYRSAALAPDTLQPTILMAHGWGGVAAQLTRDAVAFARAGYTVLTFDYRGWGESDGRIILANETAGLPAERSGTLSAEVREIREIVDPVDMLTDWHNALHWLHGEPGVDVNRIGLWGSSQSGGYVVEMAIRDPRVKAVHSQVGSLSGRSIGDTDAARQEATARARWQLPYPEAGARVVGNLRGAPIAARFANYSPVDNITSISSTPIQFVLAENEELFDNREHGILAHERYQGPKRLVIIPGITHYGIYSTAWQQSSELAIEWFDQHLK